MKKINWVETFTTAREAVSDAQLERLKSRYARHEGESNYSYECRLCEEFFQRLAGKDSNH